MLLKVVAAYGRRDVDEMEMLNVAAEIIEIAPQPGTGLWSDILPRRKADRKRRV